MPPRGIRTSAIAGVRAAWSGSVWADAGDRRRAEEMETLTPGAREATRLGMEFHAKACRWALGEGVQGVIFAACGLPADPEPHLSYDDGPPRALPGRFAFADADPGTTLINQGVHGPPDRVKAVQASAREPSVLLDAAGFSGRVCVQLQLCAHWWPADMAAGLVAEYGRLLPPGSILVMSLTVPDPGRGDDVTAALDSPAGILYRHTADDVAEWIGDADLVVAGGVVVKKPGAAGAAWGLCEAVARVP
jgi:hypothetical protein